MKTVDILDSGASMGFFNELSRKPNDQRLVKFHWCFLLLVGISVGMITGLLLATGRGQNFWPGQLWGWIWMSFALACGMKATRVVEQIFDARGLTIGGEIGKNLVRFFAVVGLVGLFWFRKLTLESYFLYGYALIVGLLVCWAWILRSYGWALFPRDPFSSRDRATYGKAYIAFTAPLWVMNLVGLGADLIDRWLLQKFAGAVEQGFFGLSSQVGSICFVFTGAMMPLLMREYAIAHGQNEGERLKELFLRHLPFFFSLTAFLCVFLAFSARDLTSLLWGSTFKPATSALSLMFLYPIHQTYGQLSGSLLFATSRTKTHQRIGISMALFGLGMTIFFIRPPSWFPWSWGASTLALKMVGIQVIATNIQLKVNTTFLGIPYRRLLFHQFGSLASFTVLGELSRLVIDPFSLHPIGRVLGGGSIYAGGAAVILWLFPWIFGLVPDERKRLFRRLLGR